MFLSKPKQGHDFTKEREKESQRLQTLDMLKRDDFIKRKTNWEVRTNVWVENTQIQREANKLRSEAQAQLNERRKELALLLDREDQMYKHQIVKLQPTTSDRQNDIIQRAITLKAEREARQKIIADEAYERQFRLQSDELRTKESQIRAWKIAHGGRRRQLEEHEQIRLAEEEQERKWAELWEKDRLRKEYREQLDQGDIKARNHEMKTLLDIQVKDNVYFKDGDSSQQKESDRELLNKWKREYEEYEQNERDKKLNVKNTLINNGQYNQTILNRKMQEEIDQRNRDKQLINSLLDQERRELESEEDMIKRMKAECKNDYFFTLNKRQQDDTEMKERDKYINQQLKIVNDKEDAEEERQRLYRENLLREVLTERGQQVKDKDQRRIQLKELDRQYADELKRRIALEEEAEREKQRLIYEKNLRTRDILLRQTEFDHDRENKEKQLDLALYKRMLDEEKKYKLDEERILRTDIPEDVYHGVKHLNFYS